MIASLIDPLTIAAVSLSKVAPDLLLAISFTIPAIAIFVGLSGKDSARTNDTELVFYTAIASLFFIIWAAGLVVIYMIFKDQDLFVQAAAGIYLFAMLLLAGITGFIFIRRHLS